MGHVEQQANRRGEQERPTTREQQEHEMALIGYARVSSVGQSLGVQQDKLKHFDKLFEEKRSGSGTSDKRPRLVACMEYGSVATIG